MRIREDFNHEIEINKSRFITYLKRCESEEEARDFIVAIKKMHPKANHHCSAFVIDSNIQRSSDDKEPAGTAGVPMLEVLKKNSMEKICAVTVRYFGGIKLGAGGLIRAYSKSVSEAVELADKYEVQTLSVYSLTVDYSTASKLEKFMSEVNVMEKKYEENVSIVFSLSNRDILKKLDELLLGRYKPEYLNDEEVEVLIKGD